jgi:hypothetical protein
MEFLTVKVCGPEWERTCRYGVGRSVSVGSVSGKGATWPVPYVGGTTGTQISWGAASIPEIKRNTYAAALKPFSPQDQVGCGHLIK